MFLFEIHKERETFNERSFIDVTSFNNVVQLLAECFWVCTIKVLFHMCIASPWRVTKDEVQPIEIRLVTYGSITGIKPQMHGNRYYRRQVDQVSSE